MIQPVYSKKMFVADLIITSIWALFTLRYAMWGAWPSLIYILMRIVLCFEMRRKSPWVLYSAIAFALCYFGYIWSDVAIYPFRRMAYFIGAWIGNGNNIVEVFSDELDQDLKVWLYASSSVFALWLIGLPLAVGIMQKNIRQVDWKKRWLWGYIIIAFCIGGWISYYSLRAGAFMEGLMLCILPLVYWSVYMRKGRSAVQIAINNKPVTAYVLFIIFFSLCILIGKEEMNFIKGIALLTMPPLLYLLICKASEYKAITRHGVALSICGILYYFVLTTPFWFKTITLSLSVILALFVFIDFTIRNKSIWIGIAIFILPIFVICPTILGLNPYAVLDVDSVDKYYYGYYASDGIYVIRKDDKFGLRDRYGLILEPNYERFARLDTWGRYISTNTCEGQMIADNRFGIYDVAAREFILDPESVAVAQIIQVSENSFNLLDPNERHFATLRLRGYHREKEDYIPNTIVEPHHEEPKLSLEEDSLTTMQGNEVRENKIEPFLAKAELVLKEDKELSKWAAELGECQHGENAQTYVLVDKARVAINRKYNEIIKLDSTYRKVYDKWAVLMEYLSHYLIHETYGEPFYSMQPMQFNGDIRKWYENMLPEVVIDKEILFGDKIYIPSVKPSTTSDDIDTFFYKFKPTKAGGYNRMWNEIKPAFFEWRVERDKYAENLAPHKRLSYEEHTNDLTDYLFKEIKGLLISRNDNIE